MKLKFLLLTMLSFSMASAQTAEEDEDEIIAKEEAKRLEKKSRTPLRGDIAAGVNFNVGNPELFLDPRHCFGFGGKIQYSFSDLIRVEPSFNYLKRNYSAEKKNHFWNAGADVHVVFKPCRILNIYPLGGVGAHHFEERLTYGKTDKETNSTEKETVRGKRGNRGNSDNNSEYFHFTSPYLRYGGGLEVKIGTHISLDLTIKTGLARHNIIWMYSESNIGMKYRW